MSILVLISGSGSNLQALIDAKLPIKHVVSSSPTAYGLERAQKAGIPTSVHSLQTYYGDLPKTAKGERKAARSQFNKDLSTKVLELKPSLVVCAGWMLILAPSFLDPLAKANVSIINLHPALPGAFPGINAIDRAWEAGQKGELSKGGVMIHYVIAAVDEGKPLVVKEIDLRKDETLDEYTARVHQIEHIAIVEGTRKALEAATN
ncbi:Phosphoribosylglycinamide formyltransferase [Wickerhamiella sorbophila]|uniref:Phosphoribosylglycinamide formyltransferase n=1 Tax=Wickerhamiella sorbophila TaxID=45607 RepID=A0A2T0FIZ4_9ASCO|nr:Phosphoribosylglycinamide formyltransferase [Wickerhamiella sorbophila]PRT54974.1 Phosphoribosylglycinamide formyltransferase [Wickerhamiella sorbophila]